MGKYFSQTGNIDAPKGGRGCGTLKDGAYVNDAIGEGCWAVHGSTITIADTYLSYQGGFEKINEMFKVDATQYPLPSYLNLNAPLLRKA